jgi:murein DD-endopeptidase MepM/ murein hydrolase activator NlpD
MATRKKFHRQFYRILVVPDDNDEPKAFNVSVRQWQMLKVTSVILAIHFIVGFLFYIKYYNLQQSSQKLVIINQQLEENNTRINSMLAELELIENQHDKFRNVLGLGAMNGNRPTPEIHIPEEHSSVNLVPSYQRETRNIPTTEIARSKHNYFALKSSKNKLHDFEKSVPTLLPVEGVLSTDFENMTYSGPIQHRGIDIAGKMGDIVKASANGVVLFSGWTYDLGNLIIIYHGDGFYTYYGHNQRCLLQRGSLVKKGQAIALLGNTGISSAPHLHFEIWKDGVPLDPKQFILAFTEF